MKHLKTRLTILLCVLSIMLLCFGLVACGTKTYKVTLDYNAEQGTVTLSPEAENNEYEEGTELTVTVTPNSDYELDTLTLSTEDRAATPNNEGKFVFKVQEDTTVRVTFKAKTPPPATDKFTLTVPASVANGTIEVSPESADNKYDDGTEITVTLKPAQGYEVDTFTVGGADKKADLQNNVYKFNITADTAINATFKSNEPVVEKFTLTVPASVANGSIAVSPESADNKYDEGTEITVTLTPAQGYEVDTFTVGGADKKADLQNNVYKFNITADTAVNATFKATTPQPADKFTLTVPASVDNGTVKVEPASADNKYDEGTEITVTLTPAQGYEVATFTVGGVDKKADLQDGVYKFNITADTAITVSFSKIVEKYTLTVPASVDNGTVAVSPESADNKYDEGTEITVTLTPAQGYEVATFTVGGVDKKADLQDGVYKFNITADTTIAASFSKIIEKFTLTVPASVDNGTVKVEPASADNKYDEGTEITVTLTPAQGYVVDTFTVGGVDKKADLLNNVYKFKITADTTISVTFKQHVHERDTEKGLQKDETTHWYLCKTCGEKMEEAEHTAKDATYQKEDGKHYQLCVCGAKVNEAAHSAAEGAEWKQDTANNQHYKECVCGEHVEVAAHSAKDDKWLYDDGDEETGKHYQLCECGAKVNESNHDIDPEAYSDGTAGHHFECTVCGYKTAVAAHEQGSSEVKSVDAAQHSYRCDVCNAEVLENHELTDWDFSDPTHEFLNCTKCEYHEGYTHNLTTVSDENGKHHTECSNSYKSGVKCTYKSEPVPCDMQWTKLKNEAEGHKGNCPTCGYSVESEAHDTLGEGGACSKCGYLAGHTHTDEQAKLMKDGKELTLTDYKDGLCDVCGQQLDNAIWSFDTTGKITKFNGTEAYTKVVVPVKIESLTITSLGGTSSSKVFKDNKNITDVIIPEGINLDSAGGEFSGCTSLQSAMIFGTMNTATKMSNMFKDCSSLTTLVWSTSMTSLKDNMFGASPSISKIDIYYLGTSAEWDSMVDKLGASGAAKKLIEAADSNVLFYSSESTQDGWHWKDSPDCLIPEKWN